MTPVKIFLSYRRDDSAFAAQSIHDRLSQRFGQQSVFMDVDSIPPGVDFRDHIGESIAECKIMIVIIGVNWLKPGRSGEARLGPDGDYVRIEIESAHDHGLRLLPVLIGKATMPTVDKLPEKIKSLAYRQASFLRTGRDYQRDLDNIIRAVEHLAADRMHGQQHKPGTTHETSSGIREIVLPTGVFEMGSPDSDSYAGDDEKPQRMVRIPESLSMSITPITQGEYEGVLATNPSKYLGDPGCPVETLSLGDAAVFCNALSQAEGLLPFYEVRDQRIIVAGGSGYRLPREFEWEYACRAGTKTRWSFGDDESRADEFAWFDENSDETTQPVGAKAPNPWGLHDMHGNVWELCWDVPQRHGAVSATPASMSPPGDCSIRGGCFRDPRWGIRSAYRSGLRVAVRSGRIGFRVVRTC